MTTAETVLIVIALVLIFLVIGNLVFSKLAERRNPPIGMFIQCDGVRLHYIERGDPAAPCVVLFHGNGSMLQDLMISGLVDLLAQTNRVVCFDRPGFGYSQRPRFRIWNAAAQAALFVKALNQLGVRDPVVLGHSWGTLVAIALSLRKDYPIRGLVLASGYYFPTSRWDVWLMSGPAVPVLGDLVSYTVAPIISWAILPAAFRKIFAPRVRAAEVQKSISDFPGAQTQTVARGRGGKRSPDPNGGTIPSFVSKHSSVRCVSSMEQKTKIIEPKQAQDLHQALHSLRSSSNSECWAYGHLCRHCGYCDSRQFGRRSCKFDQSGRLRNSGEGRELAVVGPCQRT